MVERMNRIKSFPIKWMHFVKPTKHKMSMIGVLLLGVMLSACSQNLSAKTECSVFKPIYWHKSDTDGTKQQIGAHNAKYKSVCE